MTVSTKRKRTIVFAGRMFLWYVADDDEFVAPSGSGHAVRVLSPDGQFYMLFHLGQTDPTRSHVWLNARIGERHLVGRFRSPLFEMDPFTPGSVRVLLEWALDPTTTWHPVNYLGFAVLPPGAR